MTTGARIGGVLPRRSVLERKAAGEATVSQVLGANVDTALLMTGADADFNVKRVQRYAGAVAAGGDLQLDGEQHRGPAQPA